MVTHKTALTRATCGYETVTAGGPGCAVGNPITRGFDKRYQCSLRIVVEMSEPPLSSSPDSGRRVERVDDERRFETLVDADDRLLVGFRADWCAPCEAMTPILRELAAKSERTVVTVDVEAVPHVATRYGVVSIPTVVRFDAGEEAGRTTGKQEKDAVRGMLG